MLGSGALFSVALCAGLRVTFGRLEFALIGSLYLLLGTFLEERNPRKELGAVYDRYREHVPMWIPRLTPWKQEWPGAAGTVTICPWIQLIHCVGGHTHPMPLATCCLVCEDGVMKSNGGGTHDA